MSYEGVEYSPDYNAVENWGLGAWGTNVNAFTDEERAALLDEITPYFEDGTFPKIRAQIYFNSGDEKNTGTSSEVQGDLTIAAYIRMLGASPMVENDACRDNWDIIDATGQILQEPEPVDTSDVTYEVVASEGAFMCTESPSDGWNNYGNQDTSDACALLCAQDLSCAAISYNHERGQCTGYAVACIAKENDGNNWTLISIVRGASGDSETDDSSTDSESDLEAENLELRERVEMLEQQMDMILDYLQCSLEEGCGRYPSQGPSISPVAFASPYIESMKCPFSGGERSFKIQGSWVNHVSCADLCANKRDDCAFFSIMEPEEGWPMCIGCASAPKEYDIRFGQTYEINGAIPNFCEIEDVAVSGKMCDRSLEQVLHQGTQNDVYQCLESCENDSSCRFIQFSWYDEGANGKSGHCRALSRCDLVPNTDDNTRAKVYIVGTSC